MPRHNQPADKTGFGLMGISARYAPGFTLTIIILLIAVGGYVHNS